MTHGALIWIRMAVAFAIGVGIDLVPGADAYPYGQRFQHQYLIGINFAWLNVLLPFLCSFALCFKWRPPRGQAPAPAAWLVDWDASGVLIPLVMVIGLTVTHTIVLVRDMTIDPTTHSLLPFEYLFMWVTVGLPALAGSMLARAMSWAVNRVRAQ